jgi:membrane-bound ClpP family serine protease
MSIGSGIALFVVGAILAFALNIQLAGIDLRTIGYILMVAGVVVFVIGLVLQTRKRQSVSTTRTAVDPVSGESLTRRTSESDDPIV